MVSLKQLRYFDAIARTGHFGRAAETVAVSQPALSMQIQELERALGLSLIERRRSGMRLTPAGVEVAQRAARILADVLDLTHFGQHRGGELTGRLQFGIIPSVAPYLLPRLLPELHRHFPTLELQVRETQTRQLQRELLEGVLDVMLVALPLEDPEIETLTLFEDRFLLALPASRQIDSQVRATPDIFKQDKLLLLEEGHCMRDQALTYCNLRRVENIDTFGVSSLSTIVQMVANGLGLTLLPEICLDVETASGQLNIVRFADPEPSRTLGLAWRTTSPRKPDFHRLGALIGAARGQPHVSLANAASLS
ncbi:LysR substrate-binding domain-containing protein [Devosia sp.]|uniref:hydrogen peroxide-inducible genes activator n=1 Tax=Devosia sp. TaxID=1871048 RepID=UPI003263C9DA